MRPNGQTPRRTQPPHCAQSTENMTVPQSPPPTRRPGRGCRVSVVSRPARARGRWGLLGGVTDVGDRGLCQNPKAPGCQFVCVWTGLSHLVLLPLPYVERAR